MKKIRSTISALGKYVPAAILTNTELEKRVDTTDEWIRTRTGIVERHIVAPGEATSDMAIQAFRNLQTRFKVDPAEIDLIIVATITPDMFFPSTAAIIQYAIGANRAWGFDLSGACSGFTYAVAVGAQFIENGSARKVLVFGVDTMSSITDYSDRDTCVLFGDGAGVVLLEPSDQDNCIFDYLLEMDGEGQKYLYMAAGGSRNPATLETVQKKMHYVYQEGKPVFKVAVTKMADVAEAILQRNGLSGQDVKLLIPHQANKRIIDATRDRLKLRDEQVLVNIDRYANTTAATIPIGLNEAFDDGRLNPGDLVVLTSFGAGFTWGSIIMRWSIRHE